MIPIIVLAVLGLVVLVEGGDAVRRLLAFTSLVGLGVAYVGALAYPALDLPRYLGLGSTVMLAVLSPQAVQILAKRGCITTYYALSIILLAVISFGSAGTLMPENPYTANPYAKWSISGLLTHNEALELKDVASMLCCNNHLIDWRAGVYMAHIYTWFKPIFRGFAIPEREITFTFAGSYGLLVTSDYIQKFSGVLMFHTRAIRMIEAYSQEIFSYIEKNIGIYSLVYSGEFGYLMAMN